MADGNIGNLWMSLGLKDEVTKELKRISDTMQGVGKVTKNTKKELETLMNTPVEGKDVRWLEKIIKSLALASREGRDLEAALEAIKQTNKGWKLLTGKVDTSKIGEYAKMIDNISTALDRIGAKKGLTDVGLSLGMRVQDVKAAMQALKSLEGEFVSASVKRKTWGWGNDQRDQYRQELNRMIKSGEEALYGKRNDTGLHEWVEKWEKKMLDAWAAADNLRKAETAGAEAAEAGRKAAEANTAALKAEEEQAKKTAAADKELAAARAAAAGTQAKQGAGTQGTARQAAVENKEFDAALTRMTGTGKMAGRLNKGMEEAQKKAEAAVKDASVKLDGILGKLLGGKAGSMSIGDIAKKAAEGSKAIAELETKLRGDLKNNDAGKKASSGIREAIRNAQTFLDLVQQIDIKMRTIGEKRTAQPNVDTKKLKEANTLLEKFWMTLRGIMGEGKVEGSLVMGNMPKALTATMREVQWMMRSFDKENPLSVFSGGAAKAKAALSDVTERLEKLQRLMADGRKNGYETGMLTERIQETQKLRQELERLNTEENKGRLTNKAYMTSLLSDVAVEARETHNAMSKYGREKAERIAAKKAEEEARKTAEAEEARNVAKVEELVQRRIRARQQEAEAEAAAAAARRKRASAWEDELAKQARDANTKELEQERRASAEFAAQLKAQMEARQRDIKITNDAAVAYNKLGSIIKEISKWHGQGLNVLGVDATKDVRQQLSALMHYQSVLEQIRNNGGYHPITGQTVKDVIGSADYKKAVDDAKEYARETKNAVREAEAARRKRTSAWEDELAKQARDANTKELEQERRASAEFAAQLKAQMEARQRDIKITNDAAVAYNKLGSIIKEISKWHGQGLNVLGVDATKDVRQQLSALMHYQSVLEQIRNNGGYHPITGQTVKDVIGSADYKKAIDDAKEYARETKNAVREKEKARDEAKKNNKAAEREAERAKDRIDSLSRALEKLKAEREVGVQIKADTSSADAKIRETEAKIKWLRDAVALLEKGGSPGIIGNTGNGREVRSIGDAVNEQKKINREKEEAVELERKHQTEVARTAARVRNDLARAFEQAKTKSAGMSQVMQDLKGLLMQGGVVYGAQQFLMSVIQTGGELEKQHIALQSILGDMQNANQMFAQVKELALNSPFTFSELNKDVKQLAAYGVEYDQLYDTTKRLADMSSGLGVSFERIALAFGQVQARGWLDGKELRQISYAGIPLLEKLSEYYSKREGKKVTTSEVKTRISGRNVDFEDVKNVFWEMTDAGGQFYNMQQVLSETLLGRWNKLKDAWEIMLADFASGNSLVGAGLKGIIELVTTLVQSLHTLAPTIAMAMSGPLLAKLGRSIDGGLGNALLKSKNSVVSDLTRKAIEGKKLTAVEHRILQTKREITAEDIKNLARTNALTKAELRRLMVTGKITAEMYNQGMALAQESTLSSRMSLKNLFSLSGIGAWGKAAGGLLGSGIKSAFGSILSFFGGLPGIALSAGLAIFGWYEQKNMELQEKMKQTADELQDRYKQMGDFLKENSAAKAIKEGDEKAVDNMIDEYKAKIEQIAPLSAALYEMSAEEKESHEERLKYLEAQLKMLREANKLAQKTLEDDDDYESVRKKTEKLTKAAEDMVDIADMKVDFSGEKKDFDKYVEEVAEFYKRTLPKLKTSATQQEAYRAMRDNLIADIGATEKQAKVMRSAIDRALGLKDMEMEKELAEKLTEAVDRTFPEIANRIRAHEELDAESKKKVQNLMKGATAQMQIEYQYFEKDLQGLLAASNFEAVIDLVYHVTPAMDTLEKQVYDNIAGGIYKPGSDAWKQQSAKFGVLKPYLKDAGDSYDKAKSNATTELDKRYKEMKRRGEMLKQGKLTQAQYDASKTAYEDLYAAVLEGLGFKYEPDKSKAGGKKGRKEDAALEELQRQISDLKAARQMYEKYKGIGMGKAQARNKVMGLFSNLKSDKISLDDYEGSVRRLMAGFDFGKSEERKKAKTSLEREMGEWEFSEKLKPEYDRVAANFKEALEKGVRKADLEQELLEKTGSAKLAAQAWKDGAVWDAHTLRLRDEFKELTGTDVDWTMADADAKKLYEGNEKAYTLWQKITQLVTDKYVKSLQQAADIMEKTATTEEKISAVRAKYAEAINLAEKNGDSSLAERYRQQRDKEENSVRTEAFKKSGDYLMFYEAIAEMGADKAREVARQIRENLNKALAEGSIDAREYAKQAEQLEEQLRKLASGRKKLWEAGFGGRADWQIESGTAKTNAGLIKIGEGERLIREGKIEGDAQKVLKGEGLVLAGKTLKDAGEKLANAGREMKKGWDDAVATVDKIDAVVQGLNSAFGDITETAAALGADTENGGWQDAKAVMGALSGMSGSVSGIVKGVRDGDAGGVIKGAVGVITSPIKAFAAAHDAKKDREIKLAERNIKELERIEASVKTLIEGTLGGVYSYTMDADTRKTLEKVEKSWTDGAKGLGGAMAAVVGKGSSSQYADATYKAAQEALSDPENAYKAELALTMAQRDELQRQRDAEADKKKKDKDKIADYDEELKKIGQTIKDLSRDYLKEMYSIDMKSWASQLTDAVVSAWEKGEDAMDAYRQKAKELVKDVTKTVVSQKLMEKALEKPLEYLESLVEQKGRLDEGDMGRLVDELTKAGDDAVYNITAVMDALKAQGYDFSESGTGSVSSSVKNITEETADVLASYLNAIRLDVSVNRANVKNMAELLKTQMPEMGQIQRAQLTQLTQIVELAKERNEKLERMADWMAAVTTSGRKKVYVG